MSDAEAWVKLLYTYGPFALALLLLLVAEQKARAAWRAAPTNEKRVLMVLYCATWAAFFAVGTFAMYAWKRINLPHEFTIRGTLKGKPNLVSEMFTSDSGLFLRRVYHAGGFHYDWRIITGRRLPDSSSFAFVFDPGGDNHELDAEYDLPILPGFYDNTVQIMYDRNQGKLILQYGGKESELSSRPVVRDVPRHRPGFVSVAYAQEPFVAERFKERLESDDPIVRRDARNDLARAGQPALPWINDLLAAPGSSYRLRLGAISALNRMPGVHAATLGPTARAAVDRAAQDADPVLRGEARKLRCHWSQPC